MSVIELKEVHKSFGSVHALDGLNCSIREGEVCAFLGHNGAGKTTTLRLLLGLLEPDQGDVSVFGCSPVTNGEAVRRMCGVVSEDTGLYEPLSVYENLIYYADIYGLPRGEANLRIHDLLELFEMQDKCDLPVKGFSTGMKKKTALIRAMLHRPRLLLLDEPTNGLDPVSTMELRKMLLSLVKESHATIVLTTHNLEEAQKLCSKIIIFRHGRDIFTGNMDELQKHPEYMDNGVFSLEKLYLMLEGGDGR